MDKRDIGWISIAVGCAIVMALKLAYGQAVPPMTGPDTVIAPARPGSAAPMAYNFTFTPEGVDALYGALERANQVQLMVTGDRSARWDALQSAIRAEVEKQKVAAQNAATAGVVHKDEAPATAAPPAKP